jgi:hypothetical protein
MGWDQKDGKKKNKRPIVVLNIEKPRFGMNQTHAKFPTQLKTIGSSSLAFHAIKSKHVQEFRSFILVIMFRWVKA